MIPAVLLGLAGGAGVLLIASGLRAAPVRSGRGRPWEGTSLVAVPPEQVLAPAGAAVAAFVLTGWPVALIGGAVLGRLIVGRGNRPPAEADRAEAIALLIEQLSNAASAADGVETVLGNAARHAPLLIRQDVERGTGRLAYEPLDVVLDDLAEALAHPSGDQVARAMDQVAARGGSLQGALDRLARRTRALAEMHRRIEVAREQPRSTMRTVTAVVAIFTALLFLAARDWMSAYDTGVGQVILLVVGVWFWFWHRQMVRLARLARIDRFYAPRSVELGTPV